MRRGGCERYFLTMFIIDFIRIHADTTLTRYDNIKGVPNLDEYGDHIQFTFTLLASGFRAPQECWPPHRLSNDSLAIRRSSA